MYLYGNNHRKLCIIYKLLYNSSIYKLYNKCDVKIIIKKNSNKSDTV